MAKLLVHETAGVREFELVDAETHIGRELDNALRLSDPSISRHHAVIRKVGEGYEVHDNQSSNGVLVNGNRVQSLPLQDGDRVTLGQVQITFVDPKAAATEAISVTNPLGTVRMSPEEMAKVRAHQEATGEPAAPPPAPFSTTPLPPAPAPAPMAPPPAPAPLPPPPAPLPPPPAGQVPPPPPAPVPTAPVPPSPMPAAMPPVAPPPAAAPGGSNPAPSFLRPYLPPVPDDARPTGERGDFVTRLLAYLIDVGLFIVPMIVLQILSGVLMSMVIGMMGVGMLGACGCVLTLFYMALSVGLLLFWPWCWITFGATPGKKIMKLRVVPENNPYGRIDIGTAVMRMIGHILNFGIGYILILIQEDRRGLQDILSKSIVIKVDR